MENLSKKALNYCLYLLGRQSYSRKQLRDKLTRKKYEPQIIEDTLEKLSQWQYLDDRKFAADFAAQRLKFKPRGPRLVEQELRTKGIGRDLARQVTVDTMARLELNEEKLARAALTKKIGSYKKINADKGKSRALNFLIRQGFSYEIANKLVREYWSQKDF